MKKFDLLYLVLFLYCIDVVIYLVYNLTGYYPNRVQTPIQIWVDSIAKICLVLEVIFLKKNWRKKSTKC
jgi:hypothetical protein